MKSFTANLLTLYHRLILKTLSLSQNTELSPKQFTKHNADDIYKSILSLIEVILARERISWQACLHLQRSAYRNPCKAPKSCCHFNVSTCY